MQQLRQSAWAVVVVVSLLLVSSYILSLFSILEVIIGQEFGVVSDILFSLFGFGIVGGVYAFSSVQKHVSLDLSRPTASHLAAGAVAGLALILVQASITQLFKLSGTASLETGLVGSAPSVLLIPVVWILLVTAVPIAEELFFRGVVQQRVTSSAGVATGIIVSSVLFGAVHLPSVSVSVQATFVVVQATTSGVVLSLLYKWINSLYANIIAHGLLNITSIVVGL
jgi:membrane protease YdiL (CAAX protease family)